MTGPAVLLVGALLLVALAAGTARRPDRPIPNRDGYFAGWTELHGRYDPRAGLSLVRLWLGLTYRIGAHLARRGVRPDVVTLAGVWVTATALPPAAAGGRWPLAAAIAVVVSGLLDNLDGCVAVLTAGATRWGYVLDSLVDRCCDAGYLVALWLAGGRAWLAVAAGAAVGLLEYTRARASNAGLDEIGVITVGERPTRVIVAAMGLVGGGIAPQHAALAADLAAAALLGVGVVGLAQLLVVVHRTLTPRR